MYLKWKGKLSVGLKYHNQLILVKYIFGISLLVFWFRWLPGLATQLLRYCVLWVVTMVLVLWVVAKWISAVCQTKVLSKTEHSIIQSNKTSPQFLFLFSLLHYIHSKLFLDDACYYLFIQCNLTLRLNVIWSSSSQQYKRQNTQNRI